MVDLSGGHASGASGDVCSVEVSDDGVLVDGE